MNDTTTTRPRILLGTILLERNRWNKDNKGPSLVVSEWSQRIRDDGFDGLELWEPHALMATAEERERIRAGASPVVLVNSYASCEDSGADGRRKTADLAAFFGSEGMKFNFGKSMETFEANLRNVRAWYAMLKPGFRMLSENHRGTISDDAETAARLYRELADLPVGGIIHFGSEEEVYRRRFAAYGSRLTHIHCMLSFEKGPMPEADVRQRVAWLREAGFAGTYTIEFTEGVRGTIGVEELYRNALRDLRMLRSCLAS